MSEDHTQHTQEPADEANVTVTYAIYREERREETGNMLAPQFIALREYTDNELRAVDPDSWDRSYPNRPVLIMREAHGDNPEVYGPGTYYICPLPTDSADDWDRRHLDMSRVIIRQTTLVSSH